MAREHLMSRSRIQRTVNRMAHELAEFTAGQPVLLIGINQRGLALAGALNSSFERFNLGPSSLTRLGVPEISIGEHGESTKVAEQAKTIENHQGVLVLCDDVIFSGKTIFEVLKWLPYTPETKSVCIATLVDRGHREFPVSPTVCGLTLPTKEGEHITVEISEGYDLEGIQVPSLETVILELEDV